MHERNKAVAAYRALFSLYPNSVDYGLDLFGALNAAGHREEARAVIQQLRKLPPPSSDDPRIDFARSMLAMTPQNAQPFLDRAVAKAEAQGQKLMYARFRLRQCLAEVWGPHPQGAVSHCQETYDILMAAGNRLLAADALRTMGDRRGTKGDMDGARQAVSDAIALSATSRDPNLKLPAAIMDARVRTAELSAHANAKSKPNFAVPRRKLLNVVATAHRLGYYQIECDARLALAELELRENPVSAPARLAELAREAHQHGMNLIARKATALAGSATFLSRHVVSELR